MNTHEINLTIHPKKQILLQHPLYKKIQNIDDIHTFTEYHVFAVWDFMSLLKALQNKLTCTTTPWMPTTNPQTRYLINEIVLAEESDLTLDGNHASHFEMYLDAMKACGASTSLIDQFLNDINKFQNIFVAIKQSNLPVQIKQFLDFTFRIIDHGEPHQIAAAFTFGREDLIPEMFTQILGHLQEQVPTIDLSLLHYYFERHIALDADEHSPMAMQMMEELCQDDAKKWQEVAEISTLALEKRIGLWDAISEKISEKAEIF